MPHHGNVPAGIDPSQINPKLMLPLLRLERLSPSVLIALFRGVPTLVWCEEPHHGVQFGVEQDKSGRLIIPVRDAAGHLVVSADISTTQIPLPMRTGGHRVIAVANLRQGHHQEGSGSKRAGSAASSGTNWLRRIRDLGFESAMAAAIPKRRRTRCLSGRHIRYHGRRSTRVDSGGKGLGEMSSIDVAILAAHGLTRRTAATWIQAFRAIRACSRQSLSTRWLFAKLVRSGPIRK